jgi:hypothetical protein
MKTEQAVEVLGHIRRPRHQNGQHGDRGHPTQDEQHRPQGIAAGPLDVVQDEHDRTSLGEPAECHEYTSTHLDRLLDGRRSVRVAEES